MKLNPAIIKDQSFSGQITFGEKRVSSKSTTESNPRSENEYDWEKSNLDIICWIQ
jgi:hypothetical protein